MPSKFTLNHPEIQAQLRATPGLTPDQLAPQCVSCGWSYFKKYFERDNRGLPICFQCDDKEIDEVLPLCWGANHQYMPFQMPYTSFKPTESQLCCLDCRGFPSVSIPRLSAHVEDSSSSPPPAPRTQRQGGGPRSKQPELSSVASSSTSVPASAGQGQPMMAGSSRGVVLPPMAYTVPSNRPPTGEMAYQTINAPSPRRALFIAEVPIEPNFKTESHRKYFNSLMDMRACTVRPPQAEAQFKSLLTGWLKFYASQGACPVHCINCLAQIEEGDIPFCAACKEARVGSNWGYFAICVKCVHLRPAIRFDPQKKGSLCVSCAREEGR
ncbi:hypothetical protein GGR51DRAFT_506307 [Nemania sp. FL0031]|nr:hypothetical protein GGR51DRAFT_506307 [Nemania sp. FL0031]